MRSGTRLPSNEEPRGARLPSSGLAPRERSIPWRLSKGSSGLASRAPSIQWRLSKGALLAGVLLGACGTSGDLVLGRRASSDENPATGGASGSDGAAGDTGLDGSGGARPACTPSAPLPLPERRYDFSGEGTELVDLQGGESGRILGGAALDGSGRLELDGDDDYVDLPNHILGDHSVTILLWVSLVDGPAYWRIFDFGITQDGEDPDVFSVGAHYVALTTETGFEPSGMALLVGHGGPSSQDRAITPYLLTSDRAALAVVIDGDSGVASLYIDGDAAAETPLTGTLAEIDDVNNWLGRSQYSADPFYHGVYDELRIYQRALSACELSRLAALGPDRLG